MTCTCNHISVYKKMGRTDPTNTFTLRRMFEMALIRRFKKLSQLITKVIVEDDVFGLTNSPMVQASPGRQAFNFPRSGDRVAAFMQWLNQQVSDGILEIGNMSQIGSGVEGAWTNMYVTDSYKRGVQRARYEMNKAGFNVPKIGDGGGINAAMTAPFHMDRVGLLYTRVFNELKGITDTMSIQMNKVLAQGMIDGDGTRMLARKMNAVIKGGGADLGINDTLGRFIPAERRARMLAQTEMIRAHHIATVQEYKNWGTVGVKVKAEWSTSGDDRVCEVCAGLEGKIYTLDEIETMIPRHPNCRCLALPTMPEKAVNEQKTVKQVKETKIKPKKETISETEKILRAKEKSIQGLSKEQGLIYDKQGKLLLSKSGTGTNVKWTQLEGELFKDNILTHNHPVGTRGWAGSFSFDDINVLKKYKLSQMRATVGKSMYEKAGTHIATMTPEGNAISEMVFNMKMKRILDATHQEITALVRAGKMSVLKANSTMMEMFWTKFANETKYIDFKFIPH